MGLSTAGSEQLQVGMQQALTCPGELTPYLWAVSLPTQKVT